MNKSNRCSKSVKPSGGLTPIKVRAEGENWSFSAQFPASFPTRKVAWLITALAPILALIFTLIQRST